MESGGSFDRRGSVLSPSGFYDDHPSSLFVHFGHAGSPSSDVTDGKESPKSNTTIPSIVVGRQRCGPEAQYADTEVYFRHNNILLITFYIFRSRNCSLC